MLQIQSQIQIMPEHMKAFSFNEAEMKITLSTNGESACWVEATVAVPRPLSLAPDRSLETGKMLFGILSNGAEREKRVKIFANGDVYPNIYSVKITLFIYDESGAISERMEISKDIECSDQNAKVL